MQKQCTGWENNVNGASKRGEWSLQTSPCGESLSYVGRGCRGT